VAKQSEPASATVLGALLTALGTAGKYNRNDQVARAAIRWTDKVANGSRSLLALRDALDKALAD